MEVEQTYGGGVDIWRWSRHMEVEQTYGGGVDIWRWSRQVFQLGYLLIFGVIY